MTQGHFFDTFDNAALARDTDPLTSHKAAAEVPLSHAQEVAMRAARKLTALDGDCTANEIGVEAWNYDQTCMAETYRKRVKELVRRGELVEAGERTCRITKKSATAYKVRGGK